jgi:hypothetical protein
LHPNRQITLAGWVRRHSPCWLSHTGTGTVHQRKLDTFCVIEVTLCLLVFFVYDMVAW